MEKTSEQLWWVGTIAIQDGEQDEIRAMDIAILSEKQEDGYIDLSVRLSDEAMTKLEPLWGRFVWSLGLEKNGERCDHGHLWSNDRCRKCKVSLCTEQSCPRGFVIPLQITPVYEEPKFTGLHCKPCHSDHVVAAGRVAAKPIPIPGTLAHALTPGYGAPYRENSEPRVGLSVGGTIDKDGNLKVRSIDFVKPVRGQPEIATFLDDKNLIEPEMKPCPYCPELTPGGRTCDVCRADPTDDHK